MEDQKILNYLSWLKDRGQVFTTFAPSPLLANSEKPIETEVTVEQTPLVEVRLLFVTKDSLKEDESQMLHRIAQALGLGNTDYCVCHSEEWQNFSAFRTVALGATLINRKPDLTIPHPKDMIADPQLKVSAWQDLQKLKAELH